MKMPSTVLSTEKEIREWSSENLLGGGGGGGADEMARKLSG